MNQEVTWTDLQDEHEARQAIERLTILMNGWIELGAGRTMDLAIMGQFIKNVIEG